MLNDVIRVFPSSPVRHLDTVTILNYAETDKRDRAMEKAFLEVSKSSSFYIISKQIKLYSNAISGHFTGHMIFQLKG